MRIAVLITCHNRREKTIQCLRTLFSQAVPTGVFLEVYLVDDGSSDGTSSAIKQSFPSVTVIAGSGQLYWTGGMAVAWKAAAETNPDVFLWLNDDVVLKGGAIALLSGLAEENPEAVLVGSCEGSKGGGRSYGGLLRMGSHPGKVTPVEPGATAISCDTFEGNIVWIPAKVFKAVGNLGNFRHAMGDIDYGYRVAKAGFSILVAPGFLGLCPMNSKADTWTDTKLPVITRLTKLHGVKGLPRGDWWMFCRRNGGLRAPLYFVTPFLRVLLGK